MTSTLHRRAALALLTGLASSFALGQTRPVNWPTQTVKLLVGFPAGSSPDLTARALAEPLAKALGQNVIVENKVGAGGNIAADLVAKSTDGHTIGWMINGNLTIARLLNPALPYDPLKDFQPISLIGTAPLVLVAAPQVAGNSAQEFLAAARSAGGQWNYGTPGVGTVGHLGMELLKAKSGIGAQHIPYPGYPQVATAMLGGDVQLALLPPALASAQVKAGKLRAIGITTSVRSALIAEVPSLSEAGVKDFNLEIWNAAAGPKTMPPAVVAQLSALLSDIARSPEMRQKLAQQGWQVAGTSAQGLANRIASDAAQLGAIIRTQAIKAQ